MRSGDRKITIIPSNLLECWQNQKVFGLIFVVSFPNKNFTASVSLDYITGFIVEL